jgi:hypothetical protein
MRFLHHHRRQRADGNFYAIQTNSPFGTVATRIAFDAMMRPTRTRSIGHHGGISLASRCGEATDDSADIASATSDR